MKLFLEARRRIAGWVGLVKKRVREAVRPTGLVRFIVAFGFKRLSKMRRSEAQLRRS
jgi:hypothetical protein